MPCTRRAEQLPRQYRFHQSARVENKDADLVSIWWFIEVPALKQIGGLVTINHTGAHAHPRKILTVTLRLGGRKGGKIETPPIRLHSIFAAIAIIPTQRRLLSSQTTKAT